MSESKKPTSDQQPRRRGRGFFIAAGACVISAIAFGLNPNLYTYAKNQVEDAFRPPYAPPAEAPLVPGPSPVVVEDSPADERANNLGAGRGQEVIMVEWPAFPSIKTTEIQKGENIYQEPVGARSAIVAEDMSGACAAEGMAWVGMHSSPERGAANVPRDFMRQLGEKGVGSVIWLTAEDGTNCGYEVEWFKSVKKRGDGEGTFRGLLSNNPSGRDLRDDQGEPALVFISCDEEEFNPLTGHSFNNGVVYAELVQEVRP